MFFTVSRIRPLASVVRSIPRNKALWTCGIHSSAIRNRPLNDRDLQPSILRTSTEDEGASDVSNDREPPSEAEIQTLAYDFPWLYDGYSHLTRIPHYPYPKAPKVWSMLGLIPSSIQYLICKSACERMLRNNTSPEYYPDQFLQGAGQAMYQLMPLLATNVDREQLKNMMTQELYDRYESELLKQEEVKSDVSIQLAAIHDGMVKDVWVLLGPRLESGSKRGFIRWRWQSLTIALKAASDEMSSRNQVAQMMMEGVQFKVDVEFRFETPLFEPADKMVASRSMSRPDEAPIDWNWRVSDIDYLLEQDFIVRRQKEDIKDEEHAQREMDGW
ncbi:hypothetical protein BGZ76_010769 [Entomortierella beljakovae]|nr:hypothetical protein BGZ76_010769 [Entomortierella beljakovae]